MTGLTAIRPALLAGAAVLAATPPTSAEDKPSPEATHQVTLDIDNDGRMDRAAIAEHRDVRQADLYIYLSVGEGKLDLSLPPHFLKENLTTELVLGLDAGSEGSLTVTYGCGGCSNDYETELAIAHRGGALLVAGFIYSWDTRYGIGSCEIDFIAGRKITTEGLDHATPHEAPFPPERLLLADWSDERRLDACGL
jgi:hypothetical protein